MSQQLSYRSVPSHAACKPLALDLPCPLDPLLQSSGRLTHPPIAQLFVIYPRHLDVVASLTVDPVEQRPRDAGVEYCEYGIS